MEVLKKGRGVLKGSITRIENYVKLHEKSNVIDVSEFLTRETFLQNNFEQYCEVQSQIEEEDESEVTDREGVEEKYLTAWSKLKSTIKRLEDLKNACLVSPPTSEGTDSVSANNYRNLRLPHLNTPTFSGKIEDWQAFIELFNAIIDTANVDDVQKFLYLKGALTGEALKLINDLSLTNDNYKNALTLLKNRYENKLAVINAHLRGMLDTPNIVKGSGKQIRNFLTHIRQHLNSLTALGLPVKEWDVLLVFLFTQKLDYQTHKAYELERNAYLSNTVLPSCDEFINFLEKRCLALESIEGESYIKNNSSGNVRGEKHLKQSFHSQQQQHQRGDATAKFKCIYCNKVGHTLVKCFKFSNLVLKDKRQFVQDNNLCYLCLGKSHSVVQCTKARCSVCNKRHHLLLHEHIHENKSETNVNKDKNVGQVQGENNSNQVLMGVSESVDKVYEFDLMQDYFNNEFIGIDHGVDMGASRKPVVKQVAVIHATDTQILLPTALVNLITKDGSKMEARALLDSGSQTCFITKRLLDKMTNVHSRLTNFAIGGIGNKVTKINEMIDLVLQSRLSGFKINVSCAILDQITCKLPNRKVGTNVVKIPSDVILADPEYFNSSDIDLLISSEIYYELVLPDIIRLGVGLPVLQNSKLGWLVCGSAPVKSLKYKSYDNKSQGDSNVNLFFNYMKNDINELIPKFWQLEEVTNQKFLSAEDKLCEEIFVETYQRLQDGTFQVDLPFYEKDGHLKLGDSYDLALKRFQYLENRFKKNPKLFLEYKKFVDEYLALGHGKYVTLDSSSKNERVFLAHHCVIRDDAVSTKLRVVFDASSKTSSGYSLNDVMLKGFSVQSELFDILCRFRTFEFVLVTDIQKMYRMIKINPDQRKYQNILWREHPNESMKVIELQTVTYGTNSAPFLATRCLKQLATDALHSYPLAAKAVLKQCYVDNVLCGANSKQDALALQDQLIKMFKSGGFYLHKWCSNDDSLLKLVDNNEENNVNLMNVDDNDATNKVLGIVWFPKQDVFKISVPQVEQNNIKVTKRIVLSKIAQMYDPIGFLGPVIVVAKMLLQEIWASKIEWDDELNPGSLIRWKKFSKEIHHLSELRIPRWLFNNSEITELEVHGFSDASERAYGACVYIRAIYSNNIISCQLLCSKSRIAPLKTVSLPRLELCGALLLSRLVSRIRSIIDLKVSQIVLWTDSKIVLAWLNGSPNRWTTFVANRVSEVQELTLSCQWRHIKSDLNPADCLSRGLTSQELLSHEIWWKGPQFLLDLKFNPSNDTNIEVDNIPEQKKVTLSQIKLEPIIDWSRFSNFNRLQRALAYCFRFVDRKDSGALTVRELRWSLNKIVQLVQVEVFSKEIEYLKVNKRDNSIFKTSSLKGLNPFLDSHGILRVNGRLSKADIDYNQKFPIVLPANHHVVRLLIWAEHIKLFHAGPQAVLANLRLRFWPIHGLLEVKSVTRKCVRCHRLKAQTSEQLMGSLPLDRVSVCRPFLKVGVDFGGPILVRQSRIRGSTTTKSYIALFICMITKAIHIELVSSLTTECFLYTLKRFIARRGCPIKIYSDNATNFQGTNNLLRDMYLFFKDKANLEGIHCFLAGKEIEWKFIPPLSPHWGGLWEAGIKSTKYHLRRIVGNLVLSFEEMTTILSEIEAILNSRPLCAVSADSADFNCLTPAHFLIGEPLLSCPEKDVSKLPDNRLTFWKLCSKIRQNFWSRWSVEYLSRLQNRPKWFKSNKNLDKGMIVLVKEENTPPLQWVLARIIEAIPGSDGKVRVARIRTKDGEFIRPIVKLSPLPFETDFQTDQSFEG